MDSQQTDMTSKQTGDDDGLPSVDQALQDSGQTGSGLPLPVLPPSGLAGLSALQPDDPQQTIPDSRSLIVVPDEASDSDLIEKEWVIKAKQIVEHTAEDPYLQQQELSKMKADYMKKRYNKDLGTV